MKYRVQNTRILASEEVLTILRKSAKMYSEYADTTLKGTNKVDRTKAPIPTNLLNNSITDYCSRPQKIMYILQKTDGESTYNK